MSPHRRSGIQPKLPSAYSRAKVQLAGRVLSQLRRRFGPNLLAVGISGSVARGTAEKYSDIDLQIIVRNPPSAYQAHGVGIILEDTYVSTIFTTWKDALSKVGEPHYEFPETFGGFTKILPLFDPQGLLPKLEARARAVHGDVFLKSAQLALTHSYEDFCRVKNAYLKGDDMVMRANVQWVMHSAALVVASLNCKPFASDREIFKVERGYSKLPKRFMEIQRLGFGGLSRQKLFDRFLAFYVNLVDFCRGEGLRFPVDREALIEVSGKR